MSWPSWYSKVLSRAGGSLDRVYAQVIHTLGSSRFFGRGWGDLSLLNPDKFHRVLMKLEEHPIMRIDWQPVQNGVHRGNVFQVFEGKFTSPAVLGVPNLPQSCQQGRVWLMRPVKDGVLPESGMRGCVIQLAATGEHRQERRVLLAKRLLPSGIGTLILESPFYGSRKPPGQRGSKLLCVADLIKLGATTILEAVCLIWMLRKAGVANICVAGWSMGAIHACMVASLTRFPVATAAIMPPRSASTAYCDGALSSFVDFNALRTARDAQGVPVLDTVSHILSRRPNYPNTPALFEHLSQQASVQMRAGSGAEAAARLGQAEDQVSTDVHAWSMRQTEIADWPGDKLAMEPRLPPLEEVQHAHVRRGEQSSAFLTTIPAASALTPQLQRFLSALSAVTVPLWRPKRNVQRAMQHRAVSSRRRPATCSAQRHQSRLPFLRRARGKRSSLTHTWRQQPLTLVHLRNVLTALQQVSQLRMSREDKVHRGRRRRRRETSLAPSPSAQLVPPPCITVHRTTGAGMFWETLNELLIAEIRQHLDAPFFRQEPHGAAPTSAPVRGTSGQARTSGQIDSRAPLEEAVNALPSNRGAPQGAHASELATGSPAGEASKAASVMEIPARNEQLPTVAAYQRAIVKSIVQAAGIMSKRWPPLTRSTASTDKHADSSPSDWGEGCAAAEPSSAEARTLQLRAPEDRDGETPHTHDVHREAVLSHQPGHRHGHPRRSGRTAGTSRSDPLGIAQEQAATVTGRYSQLLKKVVSGEYLLGESDELHSDDEGDFGQHTDGLPLSATAQANISHAGQELLLAVTLEAFTDLCRYPRPQAPHAAVLVAAENDGYVSPHAVRAIHKHWRGSQLWHANGGHVSSFITLNSTFVRAVRESLSRLPAAAAAPADR